MIFKIHFLLVVLNFSFQVAYSLGKYVVGVRFITLDFFLID